MEAGHGRKLLRDGELASRDADGQRGAASVECSIVPQAVANRSGSRYDHDATPTDKPEPQVLVSPPASAMIERTAPQGPRHGDCNVPDLRHRMTA